jgi:hypothetical protein
MSEHHLPRQPRSDEVFGFQEAATGKFHAIRECTDEQLVRYLREAQHDHKLAANQVLQALNQAEVFLKIVTGIAYEIDRRQRSITIANVTDLKGLTRQ